MALRMRRDGLLKFFTGVWREHGDLTRIQIGSNVQVLAVHPEHVRYVTITNRQSYDKVASYDMVRELLLGQGLVTSTGDLWKRQRRLMAPFFTPRGVEQYYPIIVEYGAQMGERWQKQAAAGEAVELMGEMMHLTGLIILKAMFGSVSEEELGRVEGATDTMIEFVARRGMNPLSPPLWAPTPAGRRYQRARVDVDTFIGTLIARRRALPPEQWPDDLLTKLMRARDEETGEGMSDELLRDESVTIFAAGHETTARSLTFLFYALSQHPDVEARLHEEIDRVIGDRVPTVGDLGRMPYTLQVIKETLRLYPPAPLYVRDAIAEDEIDGLPIPSGTRVMLLPYATHRHPEFWPDPERFDPDRWLPEVEDARHPYAFHPFAAGQRICLGNSFSLFESHLLVAILARRFALRPRKGHKPKIDMIGTLVSTNGMPMSLVARR
ncbi:MAG: cytochrome P450 [Xanthomonadales bacterium]|nr:cytochrome P450 [Xanthomonadales bacterium]